MALQYTGLTDLSDSFENAHDDHRESVSEQSEWRRDDGQQRGPCDGDQQKDLTTELDGQDAANQSGRHIAIIERRQDKSLCAGVPFEVTVAYPLITYTAINYTS